MTSVAPGVALVSPPPAVPYGAMPAVHHGTSSLAIWSLVCGGLSLLCNLFTAIPAIILGHMGLAEIRKNPGLEGRGMAMAGLIIGYFFLALYILIITASVIFASLGSSAQDLFKTINAQLNAQQASSDDSSTTNSDFTTNAPDQSTNSATATPDSSTNAAPDTK